MQGGLRVITGLTERQFRRFSGAPGALFVAILSFFELCSASNIVDKTGMGKSYVGSALADA